MPGLNRRHLLRAFGIGAGLTVAAPLLAACGGAASPTAAPAKPAAAEPTKPAAAAAAAPTTAPAAPAPTKPAEAPKPAAAAEPTKPAAAAPAPAAQMASVTTGKGDPIVVWSGQIVSEDKNTPVGVWSSWIRDTFIEKNPKYSLK